MVETCYLIEMHLYFFKSYDRKFMFDLEAVRLLIFILSSVIGSFCFTNIYFYLKQRKGQLKKGQLLGYSQEDNEFFLDVKIFKDGKNIEIKHKVPKNKSPKYIDKIERKIADRFDLVEYENENGCYYLSYVRYGFYSLVSGLITIGLLIVYFKLL